MNIPNRSFVKKKNNLPYLEVPEMARLEWLQHAFLTRKGGISPPPYHSLNLSISPGDLEEHVQTNKRRVAEAFRLDGNQLILLHQIHQDRILILKDRQDDLSGNLEYDAVITGSRGRFLGIKTADCLPILVVDRKKKTIAAIHAGRQGTGLQVARKTVRVMKAEFGCSPKDLLIALGPCIGPCCYEVDEKVFLREWVPFSKTNGHGKWMIDLPRMNIAQMKEEDVGEDQIFRIDFCTCCHPDLFFSYRGEGKTGRQLSFIGITK